MSTTGHRFTEAGEALAHAVRYGAPAAAVVEERADTLEACGDPGAALDLRLAGDAPLPEPPQLARIACLRLIIGDGERAWTTFARSLRGYRLASPLPLAAMLYGWGHALEHIGDRPSARKAYRAVLGYLPAHARARTARVGPDLA